MGWMELGEKGKEKNPAKVQSAEQWLRDEVRLLNAVTKPLLESCHKAGFLEPNASEMFWGEELHEQSLGEDCACYIPPRDFQSVMTFCCIYSSHLSKEKLIYLLRSKASPTIAHCGSIEKDLEGCQISQGNKEIWTGKHSGSKGYTCEDNQSTVSPNVDFRNYDVSKEKVSKHGQIVEAKAMKEQGTTSSEVNRQQEKVVKTMHFWLAKSLHRPGNISTGHSTAANTFICITKFSHSHLKGLTASPEMPSYLKQASLTVDCCMQIASVVRHRLTRSLSEMDQQADAFLYSFLWG
ncbi:hypothetical protein ACRRTK_024294 [Alexandromys fortis]